MPTSRDEPLSSVLVLVPALGRLPPPMYHQLFCSVLLLCCPLLPLPLDSLLDHGAATPSPSHDLLPSSFTLQQFDPAYCN